MIPSHGTPVLIQEHNTICITIKSNADIGLLNLHPLFKRNKCFFFYRIRFMVWE